ncbi:alpha-hydroxy-acid oxidizing protein [Nesterenkonia pannonica]|uniref:alpha-hydroxy-acid oxidizing protein n=1 Tax=Nesterenkonia pannonica TaxID=1548602 RepID=UPI002164DD3B|nr:alpha-hydroxy-acid oxidizing protein [Nesterenkonia pannonica]
MLPGIAEAVGDEIEVLLDGGVRRGSDVAKAVALGAKAVMIGRAYLWGLAANGQVSVENVLDIMRGGLEAAVLGQGKASIHDLSPDDLVVPEGFFLRLGSPVTLRVRWSTPGTRRVAQQPPATPLRRGNPAASTDCRPQQPMMQTVGPQLQLSRWPWPEIHEPVVLLPLGSTEQHGPHLPVDTDTRIAQAVAEQLGQRLSADSENVLIAPAVAYGASGEHA